MQEVAHGLARLRDHGVRVTAGRIGSARVGVVAAQVAGNRVNHALRNLRPARPVEKGSRVPVHSLSKRRKLRTGVGEVECRDEG
jgi:hypothetical protein